MGGGENSRRWGLIGGSDALGIPLKINIVLTIVPPGGASLAPPRVRNSGARKHGLKLGAKITLLPLS